MGSNFATAKLYEDFTALPADRKFKGTIPQPTELMNLGKLKHIIYVSNKWSESDKRMGGKDEYLRYIHDWKHNHPLVCFDKEHEWYHLIGQVVVKAVGITDSRGKQTIGNNIEYNIPKEVTFLGFLEEMTYTSKEDGEDYSVRPGHGEVALCSNGRGDQLFIVQFAEKPPKRTRS